MSEKGSEPDIEARRFNVAEVPGPDVGAAHGFRSGDVIRRPEGKSGFRFSLPHYLLRDPLGDYLL